MTRSVEIRPLTKEDDRRDFCCGHPSLDRFFEHYAGQNQFKLHLAVTYVAASEGRIIGFATVAASSIEAVSLPSDLRKRLPTYPLPILRLARLGVDLREQRKGIGRALLQHVCKIALAQRDQLGCVGLLVDAKPESEIFYKKLGFAALQGAREGRLLGDPMPMFIALETLRVAIET
ncbi:MAG: GNAT family N-acetyltransferase [Deltaproteobacteria bacterium]|nr:GNAT family N-acetyltransferase [Deltaproteobacteria bacterium]